MSRGIIVSVMVFCALLMSTRLLYAAHDSQLHEALKSVDAGEIFPGADRLQILKDHDNIAVAEAAGATLGYVFINSDFVDSTGYSGKPIHVLVAMDTAGVVRGVLLLKHYEPIVLAGIPESSITDFMQHLVGLDLAELLGDKSSSRAVDAVSGATVTTRVIDDSVIRSAFKVTRQLGLAAGGAASATVQTPAGEINTEWRETQDWLGLIADKSVTRLHLNVADVTQAFVDADLSEAASRAESEDAEAQFIEFFAAPVSVPAIGLSLLGEAEYANLQKALKPGQQAIMLMGRGLYSYKGSGYVRGGIFDRVEVHQGEDVARFFDYHNKRLRAVAAEGAPDFKEVDLFYLPESIDFDVTRPWFVDLLVGRATGPTSKSFVSFSLDYRLPEKYLLAPVEPATPQPAGYLPDEPGGDPLWQQLWIEKLPEVIVLCFALVVLTVAFFAQDRLVRHPKLLYWGRIGFLTFTLFGLGLYANAQLSVVNIMTVFNALASGFRWTYFLMEPLIFILWGSVIIALLFWGRGAYCGWLCPYGALQELIAKISQAFKIKQIVLPWGLHERLWAVKYVIFIGLFGVSLHSLALAEYLAEIEPFKTVIILKFMRDWPFVIFALLLLLPSLFIERFYCRYLCPLGAALAIPARLRMFDWLKRYHDCGNPCQTCASDCMIGAIHPEGNINPNECHYCLHCQQLYHDEQICPVMVKKRKKREKRASWTGSAGKRIDIQITEESVTPRATVTAEIPVNRQ